MIESDSVNDTVDDATINPEDNSSNITKDIFEKFYEGFEDVKIHNDVIGSVKENGISLVQLYAAFKSCIHDDIITADDVKESMELIHNNSIYDILRKKWDDRLQDADKQIAKCKLTGNVGYIINSLKYYNTEYYEEIIYNHMLIHLLSMMQV